MTLVLPDMTKTTFRDLLSVAIALSTVAIAQAGCASSQGDPRHLVTKTSAEDEATCQGSTNCGDYNGCSENSCMTFTCYGSFNADCSVDCSSCPGEDGSQISGCQGDEDCDPCVPIQCEPSWCGTTTDNCGGYLDCGPCS